MKDKTNKRTLLIILGIVIIVLLVAVSTYAYWTWVSNTAQRTNVEFTIGEGFSCSADGGGNITSSTLDSNDITLVPSSCTNASHTISRTVKLTTTVSNSLTVYTDMWLTVNSIGSYLSESNYFSYVLTTANSCNSGVVASGTFKGTTAGSKISLVNGKSYTKTATNTYYLWIWLDEDETEIPPSDASARAFDFSIGGECTDQV